MKFKEPKTPFFGATRIKSTIPSGCQKLKNSVSTGLQDFNKCRNPKKRSEPNENHVIFHFNPPFCF